LSRTRRVFQGLAGQWILVGINFVYGLLVTPFFLRVLGPELLGFRSFINSLNQSLQVSNFGIKHSVASIIAKEVQPDAAEEQRAEVIDVLRTGAQFQLVVGIGCLLVSFVVAAYLEHIAKGIPPEYLYMARVFTVAAGLSVALVQVSQVYQGVLIGHQLMGRNSLYQVVSMMLRIVLSVLLVYLGYLLYGISIGLVAGGLFIFVQVRWRAARLGVRLDVLKRGFNRANFGKLMKVAGWVYVGGAGGLLVNQGARIILGLDARFGMTGVNQLVFLTVVPYMIRLQVNRVPVMMRPGLTQLANQAGSEVRLQRLTTLLFKVSALLSATAFLGIWLINGPFITRWVGAEHYAGEVANLYNAAAVALTILVFPSQMMQQVYFEFKRYGMVMLARGLVYVALVPLLLHQMGLPGALLAGVLCEILVVLPFASLRILRRVAGERSLAGYLLANSWLPLMLLAAWVPLSDSISYRPTTYGGIVVASCVIGLSCLLPGYFWLGRDIRTYLSRSNMNIFKRGGGEADPL